MYKYIVKKMDIGKVIIDCNDKKFIEMEWNISPSNVNRTLHFIYRYFGDDTIDIFGDKFEIILFMRYLGVPDAIMKETLKYLFGDVTIYTFMKYCADVPFDEIFCFVLDNFVINSVHFIDKFSAFLRLHDTSAEIFKQLVENIKIIDFPIDYKIQLLTKLVYKKISEKDQSTYMTPATSQCKYIASLYKYFNQPTDLDFIYYGTGRICSYNGIVSDGEWIVDPHKTNLNDIIFKNIATTMLRENHDT